MEVLKSPISRKVFKHTVGSISACGSSQLSGPTYSRLLWVGLVPLF